jgi:hypothetical protein
MLTLGSICGEIKRPMEWTSMKQHHCATPRAISHLPHLGRGVQMEQDAAGF